jgi:hypothetical protein
MYVFMAVLVHNLILGPSLSFVEYIELPVQFWTLGTLVVGLYTAGRTYEKTRV